MNAPMSGSPLYGFPATATLAILAGLASLINTSRADERQTAQNSSIRESRPVQSSEVLSNGPAPTATQRFMQALEEQRKTHSPADLPDTRSFSKGTESYLRAATGITSSPTNQTPWTIEGAPGDGPLEQAKTARFLLLKLQLQQLKLRLNESGNGLRKLPPHPSPAAADNSGSSPVNSAPQLPDDAAGDHAATIPGSDADSHAATGEHRATDPAAQAADHFHATNPPLADSHHDAQKQDVVATREAHSTMPQFAAVDGPIDRLGLANNLYAVGEYLLAMEMYEQADATEMTAQQQIWTEYQIANCLRRIGRKNDATNRYRRLAAQPEAGWLSGQSQWWFEVLEQTKQLEIALAEDGTNTSGTAMSAAPLHSVQPLQHSKEPKHGEPFH